MSMLRTTGAMMYGIFSTVMPVDDSLHVPSFKRNRHPSGCDALWDRSGFMGNGGASFFGNLNSGGDIWDWSFYDSTEPGMGQRRETIAGITRDINGNALGSVTVRLFRSSTGELVDTVTSDANGNFTASTPYAGETVYARAVNAGNTLSGATAALTPA